MNYCDYNSIVSFFQPIINELLDKGLEYGPHLLSAAESRNNLCAYNKGTKILLINMLPNESPNSYHPNGCKMMVVSLQTKVPHIYTLIPTRLC